MIWSLGAMRAKGDWGGNDKKRDLIQLLSNLREMGIIFKELNGQCQH